MVSNKYAIMASTQVKSDLADNQGRNVARSYLQNVSEKVGSIIQAKEEDWHYATKKLDETIKTIGIGVDGTTLLLCNDGYREAMVGTISLYNESGERCHTSYIGATPEYGKATFQDRMEREIAQVKKSYPQATYIGIADGAKDNWSFLESHTQKQTLDFYHATGYLKAAAPAAFPHNKPKRQQWLDEKCHQLKHEANAADTIFDEMKTFKSKKLSMKVEEQLESAITYFDNNKLRMNYAQSVKDKLPIGSGVTEAACKTVVKQRLCQSGISLQEIGAGIVLSLRTFALTKGRWKQFSRRKFWRWVLPKLSSRRDKINQYGVPILA
jgi:hypothetical protein